MVLHGASRARTAASICSPCFPVLGIGCRLFRPVYAFTEQVEFNCFPRSPLVGNVPRPHPQSMICLPEALFLDDRKPIHAKPRFHQVTFRRDPIPAGADIFVDTDRYRSMCPSLDCFRTGPLALARCCRLRVRWRSHNTYLRRPHVTITSQ